MNDQPPIRIFLSPPDVGDEERRLLLDAFDSNWIAPLGPHVDAFERELADRVGAAHAVALSSGTAGLHLALVDLGVGPGDEVITSTLTFAATANAIAYVGATPVFVDVDPRTWQMDPWLVGEALQERARIGRPPAAIITVDLYGACADHDGVDALCREHGIPIVEDAAEALGATYKGRQAGTLGDIGVFSFNGNKIITTSGGGMLVTDDGERARRVRNLATQARDPAPHYEHSRVGFNYRLSNLLAAVGRAQLASLERKLARRAEIYETYVDALTGCPGLTFLDAPQTGSSNHWLTCVLIDPGLATASRDDVRSTLGSMGIESRPVWKPLHAQKVWEDAPVVGGAVSERLFAMGLCLPSGSSLSPQQQDEVIQAVRSTLI